MHAAGSQQRETVDYSRHTLRTKASLEKSIQR